jgi:hypothetical protein
MLPTSLKGGPEPKQAGDAYESMEDVRQVAAGSTRPRSTSEEHAPGTEGESDQTVPDAPISPVGPSQARGVGVRSTSSTARDPGKPGSPRNRMSSVKGRGWSIIVSLEVVWLV